MTAITDKPLPEALMWFIENEGALPHDVRQELFFELRSRYKNEYQTLMPLPLPHSSREHA